MKSTGSFDQDPSNIPRNPEETNLSESLEEKEALTVAPEAVSQEPLREETLLSTTNDTNDTKDVMNDTNDTKAVADDTTAVADDTTAVVNDAAGTTSSTETQSPAEEVIGRPAAAATSIVTKIPETHVTTGAPDIAADASRDKAPRNPRQAQEATPHMLTSPSQETTPSTAMQLANIAQQVASLQPSQAAVQAKQYVQHNIYGNVKAPTRKTTKQISMHHVKEQLRLMGSQYAWITQNDALLQYLLLLLFYEPLPAAAGQTEVRSNHQNSEDSSHDPANQTPTNNPDHSLTQNNEDHANHSQGVAQKVVALLEKVQAAHDALQDALPQGHATQDDVDLLTPVVVPDLLPECAQHDATHAFFRACNGEGPTSAPNSPARGTNDGTPEPATSPAKSPPNAPVTNGTLLQNMFKRGSNKTSGFLGSIRRKSNTRKTEEEPIEDTATPKDYPHVAVKPGEYVVRIEGDMLGLTVENVLERTVVRTVLANGPAKKAGAKIGSLMVNVGNVETKNLTHFETIDELRQSQRPLTLVMRQVSDEALREAREEMGRLIKGAGFGNITEGDESDEGRPVRSVDSRVEAYTNFLRRRLAESLGAPKNNKDERLIRASEKLIWILTLLVVGLEREAEKLAPHTSEDAVSTSPTSSPRGNLYQHTFKNYKDASRSSAKVLLDFTAKRMAVPVAVANKAEAPKPPARNSGKGRGGTQRSSVNRGAGSSSMAHEKPLLQIGDVLQRVRTFLADTTSPPAALLRGEVIAFLCDVLDIDTGMELSAEESESATSGHKESSINDLGSAGGLLKLIVLSCPVMRSPGCENAVTDPANDDELREELRRRFGPRENFSAVDLHKLHAGNRFLAVIHRLAASRSTSARITACSLGPVVWGHLDFPHQLQLRGVITRALHDVEVNVRKSTAHVLHEIAELVFDPRCVPWLVLMCERAMTDPEPQLRSAAMTLTWHLAEHLPNAFVGDASQGSRYLQRLPSRSDTIFADVYLLQCKLLPVATRLAEDRSPSVRLAVAAQCDRLCDALGDHWSSVVIDVLLALLSDTDERVRCEAVMCVPRLANIVLLSVEPGETAMSELPVLEGLIPAAIRLRNDRVASVRVSLAAAAGDLFTLMVALQSRAFETSPTPDSPIDGYSNAHGKSDNEHGKQYKRIVDDRLIPLVQHLLNDRDPEVTSAALRALTNTSRHVKGSSASRGTKIRAISIASEDDAISLASMQSHGSATEPVFLPVLSETQVMRLLPTLSTLANSKQWRVRQSAVEIVPALLGCTQKHETRSEISKLCVSLMSDRVDAVRKTAAECLCLGGSSLGSHHGEASAEWVTCIVIPAIRACSKHQLSKQRLLSLKMIEVILSNGAYPADWNGDDPDRVGETPLRELAALALSLSADKIANVRLNVGRTMCCVLHRFDEDDIAFIRAGLEDQIQQENARETGADHDVLYFARHCIELASSEIDSSASAELVNI